MDRSSVRRAISDDRRGKQLVSSRLCARICVICKGFVVLISTLQYCLEIQR
jgi:hypothetical protein